eukprot:783970-Rhodomonas_salina.1
MPNKGDTVIVIAPADNVSICAWHDSKVAVCVSNIHPPAVKAGQTGLSFPALLPLLTMVNSLHLWREANPDEALKEKGALL